MTNPDSVLKKINNYYNKKSEKYTKILNKIKKISYKMDYDNNEQPIIKIRDADDSNNTILVGNCQTIWLYNEKTSMWYWSWNIPFINRKQYKDLIKIKEFTEDLKDNSDKYIPYELEELYFYLDTGSFYCNELIKPSKIALYLSKGEWVVPIEKTDNNIKTIQYVLITDIKSLRK